MSELGPVSEAILEYVNLKPWPIPLHEMISRVSRVTGADHTNQWYYRRLVALALECRIKAKVHRNGDDIAIRFMRLQDPD